MRAADLHILSWNLISLIVGYKRAKHRVRFVYHYVNRGSERVRPKRFWNLFLSGLVVRDVVEDVIELVLLSLESALPSIKPIKNLIPLLKIFRKLTGNTRSFFEIGGLILMVNEWPSYWVFVQLVQFTCELFEERSFIFGFERHIGWMKRVHP